MKKICTVCQKEKVLDFFYNEKFGKLGKRSVCKECWSIKSKTNHSIIKINYNYDDKRVCSFCKEEKNNSEFSPLKSRCKICINKIQKIDRQKNFAREKNHKKKYYLKIKLENLPVYKRMRLKNRLRNRIYSALRRNTKSNSTIELLGCSIEEFKKYLESKFILGMNWELFFAGKIHIDHIIPCCAFDLSKEINQKKCFHYTNLQPLWAEDNLKKGKKFYFK